MESTFEVLRSLSHVRVNQLQFRCVDAPVFAGSIAVIPIPDNCPQIAQASEHQKRRTPSVLRDQPDHDGRRERRPKRDPACVTPCA